MSYEWHADPERMIQNLKRSIAAKDKRIADLRRSLDNIKVRAYELGQRELHDMALAALAPDWQEPQPFNVAGGESVNDKNL